MQDFEICRLIYLSRSNIEGTAEEVDSEIQLLLMAARTRNQALGITGALLSTPTRFAQVIEGPPQAVQDVYKAIYSDRRHRDVRLVVLKPISHRTFDGWEMAHVSPTEDLGELIQALTIESEKGDAEGVGDTVVRLLVDHLRTLA